MYYAPISHLSVLCPTVPLLGSWWALTENSEFCHGCHSPWGAQGSGDQDCEGVGTMLPPSQQLYHYHIFNLLCCHPIQAYNPSLLPNNIACHFPKIVFLHKLLQTTRSNPQCLATILLNSSCPFHSNSLQTSIDQPLHYSYHTTCIYPPYQSYTSSCQQTSLLCLTSS